MRFTACERSDCGDMPARDDDHLAGEGMRSNVWSVQPLPFSALNSLGRGWPGPAMQMVNRSPVELIDAQDAFTAISTSVGNHVDVFRIGGRG